MEWVFLRVLLFLELCYGILYDYLKPQTLFCWDHNKHTFFKLSRSKTHIASAWMTSLLWANLTYLISQNMVIRRRLPTPDTRLMKSSKRLPTADSWNLQNDSRLPPHSADDSRLPTQIHVMTIFFRVGSRGRLLGVAGPCQNGLRVM